jgi:uncharacterized integral membrane protein
MKYMTLLLTLIFSLALLCFLYLNQGLVTITYFPGNGHQTPPLPLFAVIMLAVIAGVLMAGVIGIGEQLRLRLRLGQANRKKADLERQLEEKSDVAADPGAAETPLPAAEEPPQLSSRGGSGAYDKPIS